MVVLQLLLQLQNQQQNKYKMKILQDLQERLGLGQKDVPHMLIPHILLNVQKLLLLQIKFLLEDVQQG